MPEENQDTTIINQLRLLALGDQDNSEKDELLKLLYSLASSRLLAEIQKLNDTVSSIPKSLNWIIVELTIKKFNRKGSEGYHSESVEGHSVIFLSSDIDEYRDILQSTFDKENVKSKPGKVVVW